jgi:hypothetical protein
MTVDAAGLAARATSKNLMFQSGQGQWHNHRDDLAFMSAAFRMLVYLVSVTLLLAPMGASQTTSIEVLALDGRNGKPIPHQRLLVFTGYSVEELKSQRASMSLVTNEKGLASLTVETSKTQWIQIWVDFIVLCQEHPNLQRIQY